jgi:hypothetical protein
MTETAQKAALSDFFLRLGEDRRLLMEFERDPRRVVADAGLGAEQAVTVLEGGHEEVRRALEAELARDPDWRHVLTPTRMTKPQNPPPPPDEGGDDQGDDDSGNPA